MSLNHYIKIFTGFPLKISLHFLSKEKLLQKNPTPGFKTNKSSLHRKIREVPITFTVEDRREISFLNTTSPVIPLQRKN